MTRIETPRVVPPRPEKPVSRLAELATKPTKVVSAGEAFANDLSGPKVAPEPARLQVTHTPRKTTSVAPKMAVKRTFRYPKGIDADLKKFVHRYNLEKRDEEPELTMDEVGVVMARHFLKADPKSVTKESRGL